MRIAKPSSFYTGNLDSPNPRGSIDSNALVPIVTENNEDTDSQRLMNETEPILPREWKINYYNNL